MNKHEFKELLSQVREMTAAQIRTESIADIMQRDTNKSFSQEQGVAAHKMKILIDSICDRAVEHLETHGYQRG